MSRMVVGNSHRLRLRPSAIDLFPEIRALATSKGNYNKGSIELPTSELPVETTLAAKISHIVFLNRRQGGECALLPLPRPTALAWARQSPLDLQETPSAANIDALLQAPIHEMRYQSFSDAIDCLERLTGHA